VTVFRYAVLCYESGCAQPAVYKIAAQWSDGHTQELKTYGLTCAAHLPAWFRRSLEKQAACPLVEEETLEPPGIYRLEAQRTDKQLARLPELEEELRTEVG
jgi:hypothetical protein